MDTTVLTCGPLRLTVPSAARTPSVTLKPGTAAVEIAFCNFTGVVTFEAIQQLVGACTPKPAVTFPSHQPKPIATPQPFPPASDPLFTTQPVASFAVPTASVSAPVQSTPSPTYQPSQQFDPPMTQPFTMPSQQFPYPSQPMLEFSQTPPSQTPDSVFGSQYPLSQSQPVSEPQPQQPQPLTQYPDFMPLTPPSSEDMEPNDRDEDENDDIVLSPPPLHKAQSSVKLPAKRKVSPSYRPAVKTGKRVRFQDEIEQIQKPIEIVGLKEKDDVEQQPKVSSPVTPPRRAKPSPWRPVQLNDGPGRRWGGTLTRLANNTAVLLGGESELNGFFKQMAILDFKEMKWIQNAKDTPPMLGSGRAWHTTTAVDVNLFVFGGEMEINGERTQTNEALMYDTTYFTWYPPALSGPTPSARAGHCAALIPDTKNLLLFGGINGNRWLSDLFLLENLSVWSKVRVSNKSVRPTARSYASLTAAAGFLVLFGGNNKTKSFNDVHLFTPSDMTWTEPIILGRCPRPRTGHCAVASQDGCRVIIYGGWDDQGQQRLFYSDVWQLTIKSATECQWTCLYAGDNSSKTPGPRAGATLCGGTKADEKTYLFGGWHQVTYFNDVTELELGETSGQ